MKKNRAVLSTNIKHAFRIWLELTRYFNKLTPKEIEFLSTLLYHRHFISKEVKNEMYLNKILFGTEMRKQLRQELNVKPQIFLNILSNLRKKGVIDGESIKKAFIPTIEGDRLEITFDIKLVEDDKR